MNRYGKPHQKQDQIGVIYDAFPRCGPGRLLEICGNVYRRGMVLTSQEGQNPAYRPTGIFYYIDGLKFSLAGAVVAAVVAAAG